MANLPDVHLGSMLNDDPNQQTESIVRQVNEWGRKISNEDRTKIYKDEAGDNRIILGLLPDGTHGLAISKEGIDVLDAF